jgi:endonuclease YncB( thermonuclease family)
VPVRPIQMRQFVSRRPMLILLILFGLAAAIAAALEPPEPALSGHASVVDGDTLRLGGKRVRLLGIDAPELDQPCSGADGTPWPCGEAARDKMLELVGGGAVTCAPQGHDRYGRVLARCLGRATDLGDAMVTAGLAVADGDYFHQKAAASAAKIGIWTGSFVPPRQWRDSHGSNPAAPGLLETLKAWFR